jgi:NAD+ kinase
MAGITIGIYAHWRKEGAGESLQRLRKALEEKGCQVIVEEQAAQSIGETGVPIEQLSEYAEILISLGGDGTLLRLVRDLRGKVCPIASVNFGRLGFLSGFSGPDFSGVAEALVENDYLVDLRTMLVARLEKGGEILYERVGLNDVVVSRGERSRLVQVVLRIDGHLFTEYNADGLIVATSTGSTAYSLSAGGPIVVPRSGVFVVTPICPHVLTNRSVVVSNRSIIELQTSLSQSEQPVQLSVDGQESVDFHHDQHLTVRAAMEKVPLLFRNDLSFAEILRSKLRWSGTVVRDP